MANIKFSAFTTETNSADVDFLVGYQGTTMKKIAPSNIGGGATDLNGLSDVSLTSGVNGPSAFFINIPSGLNANQGDNIVIGDGTANSFTSAQRNIVVGNNALEDSTYGSDNVAIGDSALANMLIRSGIVAIGSKAAFTGGAGPADNITNSTIIGYLAAENATNYVGAVALGYGAGRNALASYAVAVGYQAGRSSTAGSHISIGYQAGYSQTSGLQNTNIGHQAGKSNTTSGYRTMIGYEAGETHTGAFSTGVGVDALTSGSGALNVAVGSNSMKSNNGSRNVAIGHQAMVNCTGADDCVAVGQNALQNTNAGDFNVAVGSGSLQNCTSTNNTAIGYQACNDITTGVQNTAVGQGSLASATGAFGFVAIGQGALGSSTSLASYNTAVGTGALGVASGGNNIAMGAFAAAGGVGGGISSGNNNTVLGTYAANDFNYTGSNNTMIGYDAEGTAAGASNEFTLGNSSIATLRCQQTSITALSDQRDKTDIETLPYGLDFVNSLKPKKFVWDHRAETRTEADEQGNLIQKEVYSSNKGKKDIGFIAQELQTVDDDYLNLVYDTNPEKLEATYGRLIPVLVKAIQDLSAKVTALENA